MNKNVSDQLVETLVEAGIQRIYAVTGDSLNHVNDDVHYDDGRPDDNYKHLGEVI